jgi:curved DNA-binding protein CbpA
MVTTQAENAAAAGRDLYVVLGVTQSASDVDIRKAYREQARRWHPDKAGAGADAKQRFQAISEAYEVLADGNSRQRYDYLRIPAATATTWFRTGGGSSNPWGSGSYSAAAQHRTGYAQQQAYAQAFAQAQAAQATQAAYAAQAAQAAQHAARAAQAEAAEQAYAAAAQQARAQAQAAAQAHGWANPQGYPQGKGQAYTYAQVHGATATQAEGSGAQVNSQPSSTMQHPSRPSVPQSSRPTAAELHPEGFFDQPDFRCTVSDLRALAAFRYADRTLQPKVSEVEWGRNTNNVRNVRLNFSADYLVPPKALRKTPAEFDLQNSTVQEVLKETFQAHLTDTLGTSVVSTFVLMPFNRLGPAAGMNAGCLPFRFRIGLEGDPASVLTSFKRARSSGLGKKKDCPVM